LLCLGELLEDSLDATSFYCFWCRRLKALISGQSRELFLLWLLNILRLCIDDDMSCMMIYDDMAT